MTELMQEALLYQSSCVVLDGLNEIRKKFEGLPWDDMTFLAMEAALTSFLRHTVDIGILAEVPVFRLRGNRVAGHVEIDFPEPLQLAGVVMSPEMKGEFTT